MLDRQHWCRCCLALIGSWDHLKIVFMNSAGLQLFLEAPDNEEDVDGEDQTNDGAYDSAGAEDVEGVN